MIDDFNLLFNNYIPNKKDGQVELLANSIRYLVTTLVKK